MADEGRQPVEGYGMFIWEHDDGTVSYTGSFNAAEWEDYTSKSKSEPQLAEGVTIPDPDALNGDTNAATDVEQPGGNASAEEWLAYARTRPDWDEDDAELGRNDLRDKYGSEG